VGRRQSPVQTGRVSHAIGTGGLGGFATIRNGYRT
jgi:hypothetical protein